MKYSILIPTFNAGKYIKPCLQTILEQGYTDVEIIVSDDHSTDDTFKYLKTIDDARVTIISPPHEMSMTEHWEWLLGHARGEWIMFVGQDDGLQSYFFELADALTQEAESKGLKTIASKRAYYFWPGCEKTYGNVGVNYHAMPYSTVKNCLWNTILALGGFITYFDLPQMYTTSIFHRSFIAQSKKLQGGKVFTTHPQDANLAALACILEKKYLYSAIPLGWVGTSPKSAGFSVSASVNDELKNIYLRKIAASTLSCHPIIGSFENCSAPLYFYGALLKIATLNTWPKKRFMESRLVKYVVFAAHLIARRKKMGVEGYNVFIAHVKNNGCSIKTIEYFVKSIEWLKKHNYFTRIANRRMLKRYGLKSYYLEQGKCKDLAIESVQVKQMVQKDMLDGFTHNN